MKFLSIASIGLFLSAHTASAATNHIISNSFQNSITSTTGLGNTQPVNVVVTTLNAVLGILALLCVVYILYAGMLWMTSGGNEEKATKAKRTMGYTIIGLAIMLAAWGITAYVITVLNTATS